MSERESKRQMAYSKLSAERGVRKDSSPQMEEKMLGPGRAGKRRSTLKNAGSLKYDELSSARLGEYVILNLKIKSNSNQTKRKKERRRSVGSKLRAVVLSRLLQKKGRDQHYPFSCPQAHSRTQILLQKADGLQQALRRAGGCERTRHPPPLSETARAP